MNILSRIIFAGLVWLGCGADAAMILLGGNGDSMTPNVVSRLEGLGHTVTVTSPSVWGAAFDYSVYDLVAFPYGTVNPADINHFVEAVNSGTVGAIFFRGAGAESTALALGLVNNTDDFGWQSPSTVTVLNNSHPVTD